MKTPNDNIIQQTFDAILTQVGEKSAEAAFVASMQAADMPIDKRMLANFIIQDFPWPIGVELRRLFSGDRMKMDHLRMEQILKTAEVSAQFLSFCLLAQFWTEQSKKPFAFSADLEAQMNGFRRPSFGVYVGLLRAVFNLLQDNDISPFLGFDAKKLQVLLDVYNPLVELRNDLLHQKGEIESDHLEELICKLLGELAFLTTFKLVTIKEIRVFNPRFQPVSFKHTISLLNSQHEDFNAVEKNFDFFFDSHSVLLIKNGNFSGTHLNLSPFIVDTGAILEHRRIPGVKNGIYLLNEIRPNKYIYTFTNAPEQTSFKDIEGFEEIEKQLGVLCALLFQKVK